MSLPWLAGPIAELDERFGAGRMPHALLLSGPRGIGKGRLASQLVAWLLCLEGPDTFGQGACGRCRSCALLAGGAHPDRFLVLLEEEQRQITVDAIRRLIESLSLTTTIGDRKVAVIDPAESMNRNAANALLKSLEEPPGASVLILVSHDASRLPATILSRCQSLALRLPDPRQACAWLEREASMSAQAADEALEAAAGRPLLALELARQDAVGGLGAVRAVLMELAAGAGSVAAGVARLGEIEPERLWRWLAASTADLLRARLTRAELPWLRAARDAGAVAIPDLAPAPLARLQQRAERNRRLADSPVRQDLLLREWLLEWRRLGTGRG